VDSSSPQRALDVAVRRRNEDIAGAQTVDALHLNGVGLLGLWATGSTSRVTARPKTRMVGCSGRTFGGRALLRWPRASRTSARTLLYN
jgi:hypothetical protein